MMKNVKLVDRKSMPKPNRICPIGVAMRRHKFVMLAVLPINSIGTNVSNKVPTDTFTSVDSIPDKKTKTPKMINGIRFVSNKDKNASVDKMAIKKMKRLIKAKELMNSLPTLTLEITLPKSSGPMSIEVAMAVVIRP